MNVYLVQSVVCDVQNCVYNDDGQNCTASQIFVTSQNGKVASSEEEIDCKTFEPQN